MVVVVKNLMAILITITKGIQVTQVVAASVLCPVSTRGSQPMRMSVEWRKETLFQQLDLSGLEGWSERNQAAA